MAKHHRLVTRWNKMPLPRAPARTGHGFLLLSLKPIAAMAARLIRGMRVLSAESGIHE